MEKYVINGQIGEGAQGIVLKAHDTSRDEEVALKKILIKKSEGNLPASIIREVKSLQQFKHPYVYFFLNFFQIKKNNYLKHSLIFCIDSAKFANCHLFAGRGTAGCFSKWFRFYNGVRIHADRSVGNIKRL